MYAKTVEVYMLKLPTYVYNNSRNMYTKTAEAGMLKQPKYVY